MRALLSTGKSKIYFTWHYAFVKNSLLILYTTFLGNVYKQSFLSAIPTGFELSEKLINAVVAGQLVSSLLAVCCVTVSFCSNMLMVQDKVSGARADLTVTPVKKSTLAVS